MPHLRSAVGGAVTRGRVRSKHGEYRWLEVWMRFGQVARGIVYLIPGVFALRVALSREGGSTVGPSGAIEMIGHQPFGGMMLLTVTIALAGYTVWGLYRTFFDPLERGLAAKGILVRLGYLTSALAYGWFLMFAVRLLMGSHPHAGTAHDWTAHVLGHAYGRWLVGAVGLCWIVGGATVQLVRAWRRSFERELHMTRMGPRERWWARHLGQLGLGARGLVFLIIGVAFLSAAIDANPRVSQDLGGAMMAIVAQPFGRPLLAVVALGLIAFGVFAILCVRWARLHAAPARQGDPEPSPS